MKFQILLIYIIIILYSPHLYSQTNSQKEIILSENEWYNIVLPSTTPKPRVTLSLTFNINSFIIKARVMDNHFKDGNRSWRYGDGFFINFVFPKTNEKISSDNFYGFGFSMENKKPVSVLVNKDGKYFPGFPPPPAPQIIIDTVKMTADYTIEVPWENLYPFHPLKNKPAGINIIYISQNDDKSRIIQELVEDNYDTELTNQRKFIPLRFEMPSQDLNYITGELKSRITNKNKIDMKLWICSDKKSNRKINIELSQNNKLVSSSSISKKLSRGINIVDQRLLIPEQDGYYTLTVTLNDNVYWKENLIKYNKKRIQDYLNILRKLADSEDNLQLRFSRNIIEYHTRTLLKEIEMFDDRSDLSAVENEYENLEHLKESFEINKTLLKTPGYLLAAFRSNIDSALQPFSVIVPENFNNKKSYRLIIALHGSGVDEVGFIKYTGKIFDQNNYIVVAPRGRDLSSWYTGDTELDIVELTQQMQKLFSPSKTILYGFSMGGYGVWRMGLLHPDLFEAGIVVSGSPFNMRNENPEFDMNNNIANEKKIPFLVLHGTDDNALKINDTDDFVSKLKKVNYDIEYFRVEGGGHGNFNSSSYILNWLSKMN